MAIYPVPTRPFVGQKAQAPVVKGWDPPPPAVYDKVGTAVAGTDARARTYERLYPSTDLYPQGVTTGTGIGDETVGVGDVGWRSSAEPALAGEGRLFPVGILAGTEVGDGTVGIGTVGVRAGGPATYEKVGVAAADTLLAGTDVFEASEVGTTVADTVATGADVFTASDTGTAVAGSKATGTATLTDDQFARPMADVFVGGWTDTPLWSKLDEVVADDADFVTGVAHSDFQRLRAGAGTLVDEDDQVQPTMRGFNIHVAGWAQAHFNVIASVGAKVVRQILHWDDWEPTQGNIDAGAFAGLDLALTRAEAAGLYSILELHLNIGRTPAWALEATEVEDYKVYGQFITEYLANRYGTRKSVLGFQLNEPPLEDNAIRNGNNSIPYLEDAQRTMITWFREGGAPDWIGFVSMGYAMATPIYGLGQNGSATDADPNAYDSVGGNVVVDVHDYMDGDTRTEPPYDGRQFNGMIYPDYQGGPMITDLSGGYTSSQLQRDKFTAYWEPYVAYKAQSGYPLMLGEWSFSEELAVAGEVDYTNDKQVVWGAAAPALEIWWNYDITTNRGINPFAARPGDVWRPSVLEWLAG